MLEAIAKDLRERAFKTACYLKFHQDADDLAQMVMLSYLEGNGAHQSIQYAVIDAIRKMYPIRESRPRKDRTLKRRKQNFMRPLDDDILKYMPDLILPHDPNEFKRLTAKLELRDQFILDKFFVEEWTQLEIATFLDMSCGYVSQLTKRAVAKLKIQMESEGLTHA